MTVTKERPPPEPIYQRVKRRSIKNEVGCWIWQGYLSAGGYGRLSIGNRKNVYAHRASYTAFIKTIPEGMCVLHRCDEPSCVNPNHLFLGTQADNMADMKKKRAWT
jgi:hypothetical protein